jgi:sugar phosphate isomerase/epimerase
MKKHHDKITHIHVKDRRLHDGPNTEYGKGDTPITEVLRLIRDNKWPIMAAIEFEYKVPEGSTRMAEIARCVAYCRKALA